MGKPVSGLAVLSVATFIPFSVCLTQLSKLSVFWYNVLFGLSPSREKVLCYCIIKMV